MITENKGKGNEYKINNVMKTEERKEWRESLQEQNKEGILKTAEKGGQAAVSKDDKKKRTN